MSADDHRARQPVPSCQIMQQSQRRRIGPVQVFEYQDQTSAALDLLQHPAERLEAFEQRDVGSGRQVLVRPLASPRVPQRRNDLGDNVPALPEECFRGIVADRPDMIRQCLHERSIGRCDVLVAPADQHHGVVVDRDPCHFSCQRRLADAGFSPHEDRVLGAVARLVQAVLHACEFRRPPDHRPRRRRYVLRDCGNRQCRIVVEDLLFDLDQTPSR